MQTRDPARITLSDLADLDRMAGILYTDSASTTLSQAPGKMRRPDIGALNRFVLWRGAVAGTKAYEPAEELSLGEVRRVALSIGAPVVADFEKSDALRGGGGRLPLGPGLVRIARGNAQVACFVNIGQIARVVVVNTESASVVLDSDAGPGTCLINRASREAGLREGFDRDGSRAAQGTVDNDCLDSLSSDELFDRPGHSSFAPSEFEHLLTRACLKRLAETDRIATLTALTARRIWASLKKEYRLQKKLDGVWVCGGGAHNNTLMEYLRVYGDPVPVRTVEELGVKPDSCVPLALGLSTVDWLEGHHGVAAAARRKTAPGLGTVVLPC